MSALIGTQDGLFADGRHELAGRRVSWLTRDDTIWWAAVGDAVARRDPDGWRDVGAVVGVACVMSGPHGVLAGTVDGRLARLTDDGFEPLASFDAMPGRETWHAVGSASPYVRSLTATVDGDLLANVHVGGIPRSTDGGASWTATIDVDADVHEVRAHPERAEVVFAAAAVGVCSSSDRGATWTITREGLHASYCRAVALAHDLVLVSASTGAFTEEGAVYRRALDDEGPFERCEEGLPERLPYNVDTGRLDTDGQRAAFGTPDGAVYLSEDAGRSWRALAEGLPPVTAVRVT